MASSRLTQLVAQRFAETYPRVVAANSALEQTRNREVQAKAAVASAAPDQKAAAEAALEQVRKQLAEEQEIAEFESKQLNKLIGVATVAETSSRLTPLQMIFAGLAGLALLFLMGGIYTGGLLDKLSDIEPARGLITFLIAVITVTIALVLALSTIVSDGPDRRERFADGKEVLTVLIGVLGTIVGFYFGLSQDGAKKLEIVSVQAVREGETIRLAAFVSGGHGPYKYDVEFTPESLGNVKDADAPDGLISLVRSVGAGEVKFKLTVRDAAGIALSYEGSIEATATTSSGGGEPRTPASENIPAKGD